MSQNKAIRIVAHAKVDVVDVPYPTLPSEAYMIVKTTAVAVNPTDWKHIDSAEKSGALGCNVGCDYAGIVEHVGSAVTKPFKKGDRVCGPVLGSSGVRKEDGTFATYICVKGDLQIHTPDNLTDQQAATLGVAVTTVGQGLYQHLGLALPTKPIQDKTPIMIYGGSTAMGVTGIQYAKLSGYTVITTASPRNFDYVKSLGADYVFDYSSPTLSADIRKLTDNKLTLAWDCHSSDESVALCANALSTDGGKIGTLLGVDRSKAKEANPKVEVNWTLYYDAFDEEYLYFTRYPRRPDQYEQAKKFWELSAELLQQGKIKPTNVIENRGGSGLEGVLKGIDELRAGRVSAGKLVYTL
ncbi:zinc-binding dehydrogenase [Stachybotrys elegans]|uniref:Zinc-binding dehydrogenase n=1 Tax=Stachybotrys elegans TaxID=80388 RepID=A0A8K0SPF3_9HYPO|nr:zinc-binding dehydrogenase [Stachybotrys elegans]